MTSEHPDQPICWNVTLGPEATSEKLQPMNCWCCNRLLTPHEPDVAERFRIMNEHEAGCAAYRRQSRAVRLGLTP